MTAMKQRARALENQFAHQQELLFKAQVRRNTLVGRWAANVIGIRDGEAYAHDLAMIQINEPHRLLDRLRRDFEAAGLTFHDKEIEARMGDMLEQATGELLAG